MTSEQKILLASIRELNEMLEIAALTNQRNLVAANIETLTERVLRYGDYYPGASDSGIKPHTN
jgi:hypothetical protein